MKNKGKTKKNKARCYGDQGQSSKKGSKGGVSNLTNFISMVNFCAMNIRGVKKRPKHASVYDLICKYNYLLLA